MRRNIVKDNTVFLTKLDKPIKFMEAMVICYKRVTTPVTLRCPREAENRMTMSPSSDNTIMRIEV